MAIISKNYGARLYGKDAISYDMRRGKSRISALIHAIFGRKVTPKDAEDFKKANPDYPLNDRIEKKIGGREATPTEARPPIQKAYLEQHSSSPATKKTSMPYQPTAHELPLFQMITTAFTSNKRSIEELEGLSSLQVLEKLRSIGIISQSDLTMLELNKGAADYGKVCDYARSNPEQG